MEFEKAELESSATEATQTCGSCRTPLVGTYWSASGAMVCESCAEVIRRGPPKAGGFVRALKAGIFGVAFGLVGTVVYALILAFANIEAALLTIFIGWLVGQGVKRGAEGRGGLGYQIMAAVLTYVMCAESYALSVFREMTAGPDALPGAVAALFAPVFALGVPFLGDMNVIGFLILGFGIYQGYRGAAVAPIEVRGPFELAPAPVVSAGDRIEEDAPSASPAA